MKLGRMGFTDLFTPAKPATAKHVIFAESHHNTVLYLKNLPFLRGDVLRTA